MAVVGPALALWVLCFPNAPYLLTDLVHLGERPPVPLWYDLGLLLACAGTGLALGYRSLLDVEACVAGWTGRVRARALAVGTLFLSGFGVYLGRFDRLTAGPSSRTPSAWRGPYCGSSSIRPRMRTRGP